jgi:RNA polymerase sigma-70 factor (ECF subfamily)
MSTGDVLLAMRGDHDAFAALVSAASDRLYALACIILRDTDRAEDATQEAFVRAWRELPKLRDADRFDAWLRRLVVNACIDEIRRTRRSRFDVDVNDISEPPSVADATSAIADRDQLERAFVRLDPDERAVIVLHHYLDLPLPEVAATLRIPLGTTKSRLYRGLRQMRAALDADARPAAEITEGRPA